MEKAPKSARNARVLAEAFEQLERFADAAWAHEQELMLLDTPKEIAAAARALAELYERRLDDLAAAARAWRQADEANPNDPLAVRSMQRIFEALSQPEELCRAIEKELRLRDLEVERRLELLLRLGDLKANSLSQPEAAAEAYEEVLRIDAKHSDALTQLIQLYGQLGRADAVARMLDLRAQAVNTPQQRAGVLLQKGDLLEKRNDFGGALAAYAEAFNNDPESRLCFIAYERVCYRLERWKDALELYDRAIEAVESKRSRAHRLADLYARRGQLQVQYLGQVGEGAAAYLKVLELEPESDTAQTALERIYSSQSDWAGLIAVYERRADLVKDDARRIEILRRAARVAAAKLKDLVEAARLYGRLHQVDPTDSEAVDAIERHYERNREWDKLIGVLNTRLQLTAGGEEAVALRMQIAQIYEEGLRDPDHAIDTYRKILDLSHSHKEAIESLARLCEGTEKWAELVDVTRRQIRIVTDRAQKALLYFKCGSVMESKFGKEDDAIRYYDAAIKTSPSCLPAVHGLRDLYLRRQEWPRVIQTLELESKLWTEDKERAGVIAHIGQIYGDKLGDEERAIQYYESALAVDRECLPANRALFELYFARNDFQRVLPLAVILTQKVTREGDPVERSEFYRKRAIVAERTGDARAAVESLVVALEIRPENESALDLLVGLCRTAPDQYDYSTTFRELEKLYRKRDSVPAIARTMVAQGVVRERDCDIDGAEQVYQEALKMSPDDLTVVDALVSLHERLRHWDAATSVLEAFVARTESREARTAARVRLVEIYGDGMLDSQRALGVLRQLLEEEPGHRPARFLYIQELYLLGRYADAQKACEQLIALAAAPEHTAPPEELARYYDYLGRIAEANGDSAGAGRSYRRAIDLDPAYAPPSVSLARRASASSDRRQAGQVLDAAMRAATEVGGDTDLTMRRAMAHFFVSTGERDRAIAAFRDVIQRIAASQGDAELDDRVAMAELLAQSEATLGEAKNELLAAITRDLRSAAAYRVLAEVHDRSGDADRAARVTALAQALGCGEVGATGRLPTLAGVRRGQLSDEQRKSLLVPSRAYGPYYEALLAVRETLEQVYPMPQLGDALPLGQVGDPALRTAVLEVQRLFGVNVEVRVAPSVPHGMLISDLPTPVIVVQRSLMEQPDPERRFLLGRASEMIRGGYGMISRLRPTQRLEVSHLVTQLVRPEAQRDPQAQEFVRALPRKALKALERVATVPFPDDPTGQAPHVVQAEFAVEDWWRALEMAAERAGLLACDDVGAAVRARGLLAGEPATSAGGPVIVPGRPRRVGMQVGARRTTQAAGVPFEHWEQGEEIAPSVAHLVLFYLSDAYHLLRVGLAEPGGRN
jgi:tetratricopeptide (TPR) repeat protein